MASRLTDALQRSRIDMCVWQVLQAQGRLAESQAAKHVMEVARALRFSLYSAHRVVQWCDTVCVEGIATRRESYTETSSLRICL